MGQPELTAASIVVTTDKHPTEVAVLDSTSPTLTMAPHGIGKFIFMYDPLTSPTQPGDLNLWTYDGASLEKLTAFTEHDRGASYRFLEDRYSTKALEFGSFFGANGLSSPAPSSIVDLNTGEARDVDLPDAIHTAFSIDWSWHESVVWFADDQGLKSFDLKTGQIRQPARTPTRVEDLSLSPTAARIAVLSGPPPHYEIGLMDLLDDHYTAVSEIESTFAPQSTWAPDGNALAIVYWKDGYCGVNVLEIASRQMSRMYPQDDNFTDCGVEWSHDSSSIALSVTIGTGYQARAGYWIFNRDASTYTKLPITNNEPESRGSMIWSQDDAMVMLVHQQIDKDSLKLNSIVYSLEVATLALVERFRLEGYVQAVRWLDK